VKKHSKLGCAKDKDPNSYGAFHMRPVKRDGYWTIEACVFVNGKCEVLFRQGEYDSEEETEEAIRKKTEFARSL